MSDPLLSETRRQKKRRKKEALALGPIIDAVQDALDRFRVIYESGGDVVAAFLDLKINVEDLDDAIDKNMEQQ